MYIVQCTYMYVHDLNCHFLADAEQEHGEDTSENFSLDLEPFSKEQDFVYTR